MLSHEKEKIFKRLWFSGAKENEIARVLGIRPNMVPIYARVLGLPPRTKRSPPNKKLNDEDIKLIKEMWMNGATVKEIADYFNVHPSTVLQYLHAMGLKRKTRTKCPEIPRNKLEELSLQGLTDDEIAKLFKTKKYCIAKLRQKYGINKRLLLKQRRMEKIGKLINTIVNILEGKGFTTSIELREKYGIRISTRLLSVLEEYIEGVYWFRLTYTSTAKFTVFPTKFNNITIIYLKGYEGAVASFLQDNLVNRNIPRKVLTRLLKINKVPQQIINEIMLLYIIQ